MHSNGQESKTLEYATIGARLLLLATCIVGCTKPAAVTTYAQATYATPEEAGLALQNASRAEDNGLLIRILGEKSQAIVNSGDPAEDSAALHSFVKKYDRMNRWVTMTDGSRVLYIGADNYPFPIPLVKDSSSKWHFNAAAGEEEVLARRIGRNELLAIDASKSIATAEELYRRKSHEYTPVILDPDKKDGYSFRILSADSKTAGGFAVIAAPVKYQDSGIMTFIVSRGGVVYQKDLGPQTASVAASISEYNPADGWTPAE